VLSKLITVAATLLKPGFLTVLNVIVLAYDKSLMMNGTGFKFQWLRPNEEV
jgi:hypothetical protein